MGDMLMLVTSTLLFLGFAVWTGVDIIVYVMRVITGRRIVTLDRLQQTRSRLRFLLGYAIVLTTLYVVYLTSSVRH